jgi:hypothetical protein
MHGEEEKGVRYRFLVPEIFLANLFLGRIVDSNSKALGNLFHAGFIPKENFRFNTSV